MKTFGIDSLNTMPARQMKSKRVRLFTSIGLPPEARNEAGRIQDFLAGKKLFKGSWTKPKNLHLTLKFLGEMEASEIGGVKSALKAVEFFPFDSTFGKLGVFADGRKNVRILWIHLTGEGVVKLQKQVDLALNDRFPVEHRFMSHLTIARVKSISDNDTLLNEIVGIRCKPVRFEVSNFALMQSSLSSEGPAYDVLEKFPAKTS